MSANDPRTPENVVSAVSDAVGGVAAILLGHADHCGVPQTEAVLYTCAGLLERLEKDLDYAIDLLEKKAAA